MPVKLASRRARLPPSYPRSRLSLPARLGERPVREVKGYVREGFGLSRLSRAPGALVSDTLGKFLRRRQIVTSDAEIGIAAFEPLERVTLMSDSLSSRRFTVRDGMILVAAFALAVWLCRLKLLLWFSGNANPDTVTITWNRRDWLAYYSTLYPALMIASFSILFLRLLEPRPHGLRLRRQPGFIASIAAVFIIIYHSLFFFNSIQESNWLMVREFLMGSIGPWTIAPAIGLAWLVQVIIGARRPEPGWIDRSGRIVGWTWIMLYAIVIAIRYLKLR